MPAPNPWSQRAYRRNGSGVLPALIGFQGRGSSTGAPAPDSFKRRALVPGCMGAMAGLVRRRILVNFRAPPERVQPWLPTPMRPKLHKGDAIVGVCLIRLERLRPAVLPGLVGLAGEYAAHR